MVQLQPGRLSGLDTLVIRFLYQSQADDDDDHSSSGMIGKGRMS